MAVSNLFFFGMGAGDSNCNRKTAKGGKSRLNHGPFCIIYGIGAVLITIWLQELSGLWLFLFSAVYASVVEWIAGHLIQKIYHERWWDYSDIKWNLDGYICLPFSIIWGAIRLCNCKMDATGSCLIF